MARNFYLKNDAEFLTGSQDFSTKTLATPTLYGLTAAQAMEYATANEGYALAYQAAKDPATRTAGKIAAKNAAKAAARETAKLLAAIIRSTPTVTDEQLIDLGLTPRPHRQPRPVPEHEPSLDIVSVSGWTVTGRLHDPNEPSRRGKPSYADGAAVLYFVGEEPPTNTNDWVFSGNISKTHFTVTFPDTLPAGAKVWLTAYWFNDRKESGPACPPVGTNLQGGALGQAA